MKQGRVILPCAVALTACLLTGCSTLDRIIGADNWKEWTPTSNTVQVGADGSVTELLFDTLDQNWYNGNELQDMIARSMNEYNEQHGAGAIQVTAYSDAGGNVNVTILYRTPEDYAVFNNVPFESGSMLDAEMAGCLFTGPFSVVEGSSITKENVDASEPLSHKEYRVVVSDGTHVVQVPGEIRYVSANGEPVNSHAAQLSPETGQAESEEGLVLPSEKVWRPEQKEASAKEKDQALLYVIYEKDRETNLFMTEAPEQ